LLRKGEETLPALKDVKAKVVQMNDPATGRMLPGTSIEHYYDRTELLSLTTETVTENLVTGIALVIAILFMFVNNIKTAIIVAINIPLALLFAFTMLYVRGKSANLLSIGAVDFGIIVDSSVVVVENIYRNLASHNYPDLPIKQRILLFVQEIDHALLYSVLIMVCAFVPLFAMTGPEGQLFGPMAQTYAFSLAGALVLALTLTPVLCMLLFKRFKPVEDNLLVRALAGGREPLAPRHRPAQHEPRSPGVDRQASSDHHGQLSRGRVDRDSERPARRRHGHRGLLQRRVLCAAPAAERLAQVGAGDHLAAVDLGSPARADETRNRHVDE
jgi:Cu/Ag efflux pump CusA